MGAPGISSDVVAANVSARFGTTILVILAISTVTLLEETLDQRAYCGSMHVLFTLVDVYK